MDNKIGDIIRKKREDLGLSQEALAEMVGKSTSYISQFECGITRASVPALADIISALTLDANTLFYDNLAEPKLERELAIMLCELDPAIRQYIVDSIRMAYSRTLKLQKAQALKSKNEAKR